MSDFGTRRVSIAQAQTNITLKVDFTKGKSVIQDTEKTCGHILRPRIDKIFKDHFPALL